MARTLIVSDRQNSFFTANNIKVGTQIPTTGTYSKGDIIVNIGNNTATEAMWICVEAGTPGTWEVVGAGAGGGGSLVSINESVFVNEPVREVLLSDLSGKISTGDKLIVHFNSTHLMEGIDYEIHSTGTKIVKLTEGSWNESGETNALFAFELLKNVSNMEGDKVVMDTKLTSIVNNVILNGPKSEVEIGVSGFDKNNDMLLVFKNGVIMVEGVDYNINSNSQSITSISGTWNQGNLEDYGITFVVFKEITRYDGTGGNITMNMLGSDVKNTINSLISITETNAANIAKNTEDINNKEVDVDLSSYQEKTDNSLSTSNKTIVGAINELFQNANNGKELIASAIGEPLSSGDTFNAMSNDINSLLSTFKTNMMKNGVTVESGDKFKALIDKIATLSEGEGKGIQYATGTGTMTISSSTQPFSSSGRIDNLPFTPTYVICYLPGDIYVNGETSYLSHAIVSNITTTQISAYTCNMNVTINGNSFTVSATSRSVLVKATSFTYYAIGVGEEDTTLRDSLAGILGDKGVDVSPEDDMADLITKVDSISSGGLDIISATSLPSTGKENQICVITDTEPTAYVTSVSPNSIEISDNIVRFHISNNENYTKVLIPLGNNIVSEFIFDYVYQNKSAKASYIYQNSVWTQLTYNNQYLLKNATIQAGYSAIQTDSTYNCYCKSGTGFVLKQTYDSNLLLGIPFKESIDFSKYNNVRIKGSYKNASLSGVDYEGTKPRIGIAILNQTYNGQYSFSGPYKVETLSEAAYGKASNVTGTTTQATFDLTFPINYSKTGYFAIDNEYINYVCVTDIEFFLK